MDFSHLFYSSSPAPEPHTSMQELGPSIVNGELDGSCINPVHLGALGGSVTNPHSSLHTASLPGLHDGTTFLPGQHMSATFAPAHEQPLFSGYNGLEPAVAQTGHNGHDMSVSPSSHLIHDGPNHDPVFGRYQADANDDIFGRPQGHTHPTHAPSWDTLNFSSSQTTSPLADGVTPHSNLQPGTHVPPTSPESHTAVHKSHVDTNAHGEPLFGHVHKGIHDCTFSNGKVYGPGGHVIDTY